MNPINLSKAKLAMSLYRDQEANNLFWAKIAQKT